MSKMIIRGPQDCKDSEFSAYETQENVLLIPGVYEVSGRDGTPLEATEEAEIVADKNRRDEIVPQVKRFLGPKVRYHWVDPKKHE